MTAVDLSTLPWALPSPYIVDWHIEQQHLDHYQHTNNVAYVSMLERLAWSHSNHLGLTIDDYRACDRGMAISRHEIDYLCASHLGDQLACATWIIHCDKRLKLSRRFQFIRTSDHSVVLNARTDFVCIALSSGKPKRMPSNFARVYGAAVIDQKTDE